MLSTSHSIDIGFSNSFVNRMNNSTIIPLYFTQEQHVQQSLYKPITEEYVDLLDIVERGHLTDSIREKLLSPTKKQGFFHSIIAVIKELIEED
jgi:hypothetical protein